MINLSISIGSTNRFFFIKLLTTRKLYLIINTSPRSELNENNGISPASNLYVAGYFFLAATFRVDKE